VTFEGESSPESPEVGRGSLCFHPLSKKESEFSEVREGLLRSDVVEKGSPLPAFAVRKRTVFKNRQNLVSCGQNFKISKKKIINQNTLELFAQPPSAQPRSHRSLSNKASSRSGIFEGEGKQSSLECWKRRFLQHKLQVEGSARRTNIFFKPLCLR
jgi:hypothetical protein